MKDKPDFLEAELSALRPRAISPELRRRIAEQIERTEGPGAENFASYKRTPLARSPSEIFRRRLALGGSLAAACLLAVLWWWGPGRGVKPQTNVVRNPTMPRAEVTHVEVPDGAVNDAVPTLLAYQRALARSPEELEALLNRHALAAPASDPELVRIGALTRSDAALHTLLGDD
jgi:hypothetical protein